MFYALPNTVTKTVSPCLPWEFKPTENITDEIRHNKEARQAWYKNKNTQHNFYTPIDGVMITQRVSNENPPNSTGGFTADYDIVIPSERILEAVRLMPVKPTFFETSLGGHFRLVWVLSQRLPLESKHFAIFLQQRAAEWLRLDLLPGLDKAAFEDPMRLYCNGCAWDKIGPEVPVEQSQAFFVEVGKKFRFNAGDDACIPLDVIEKALTQQFPGFTWPGEFALESMGPSFWIPDSVSPQSAIVKEGGMFTFAAHATKPFYTWTDLLGKDFTEKFQQDAIAKATENIWWDGKSFWKKKYGNYASIDRAELDSYFRVTCRLSGKAGQSGVSPIASAFEHIFSHQSITGAGSFVFTKPGMIIFQNERKLNTYSGKPLEMAGEGPEVWGPSGRFPFISFWLDHFFNPESQLIIWHAHLQHFFRCAVNYHPMPGPNYFLLGQRGIGKTLMNRHVVGALVGGFEDASDYIVNGATFNSHLFKHGLWVIDDESPAGSTSAQNRTHMMFKRLAANQEHFCNGKYQVGTMLAWAGRVGCTANMDFISTRIVGSLDNTSLDKTNLFRCSAAEGWIFPSRDEVQRLLAEELPHYARWLYDWKVPDEVEQDSRYMYASFQEKTLLDKTFQGSPTASFKEIVIEFLAQYFNSDKTAAYWEGTVSMLIGALSSLPGNDAVMRSLRLEQCSRFLEQISREGTLRSEVVQGKYNTRLWRFYRFTDEQPTPAN